MHLVSDSGSERATNDSGKIITYRGRTHVAWQDVTRQGYFNRVRTYDHATASWGDPVTLDSGVDNHARAVLALDRDGHLHAVLGGHGTSVRWTRALRPNDASAWSEPEDLGRGTYPVFFCGPDGTLYLTLRGNGQERHDRGVDLYRKAPGGTWSRRRLVTLSAEYGQAYAAYHMQMDVAPDGALHAIIDFYEGDNGITRGLHQATCYMHSPDGGTGWQKADGTPVPIPARPEDMDILAQSTRTRHEALPQPAIRQGGMVVDSDGRPFAVYLDHDRGAGHCRLVTTRDGRVSQTPLQRHWEERYPAMRAVECGLARRADDALCLLVTLAPYNDEWIEDKPSRAMRMCEREDQRLVWLFSKDGGAAFELVPFLEPGRSYNCPSVEKAVGPNAVPVGRMPAVLYFDGSRAYPGGGDYYEGDRSVADILAAGDFRVNRVFLAGL